MLDLLRTRRSIRSYRRTPLERQSLDLLIEALLRSPSSRSICPWEFVLVDDRELLQRLSRAKQHGSAFLRQAALGIVICGDETKSDVWVEDCSIAAILVQMTAESLGLGSCWIQIRQRTHDGTLTSEQYVQQQLGLPQYVRVEAIISIGHPAETKQPLAADQLDYSKIRFNHWSSSPVNSYPAEPHREG